MTSVILTGSLRGGQLGHTFQDLEKKKWWFITYKPYSDTIIKPYISEVRLHELCRREYKILDSFDPDVAIFCLAYKNEQ